MQLIHVMLHMIQEHDDLPEKHRAFFDAFSGEGLVKDVDVPEKLSQNQTESIGLEYIKGLFDKYDNNNAIDAVITMLQRLKRESRNHSRNAMVSIVMEYIERLYDATESRG